MRSVCRLTSRFFFSYSHGRSDCPSYVKRNERFLETSSSPWRTHPSEHRCPITTSTPGPLKTNKEGPENVPCPVMSIDCVSFEITLGELKLMWHFQKLSELEEDDRSWNVMSSVFFLPFCFSTVKPPRTEKHRDDKSNWSGFWMSFLNSLFL